MDDAAIRRAVEGALEVDERLSSQSVAVDVSGGRVTLSGQVQSFRRKLAAQQLAATVVPALTIDNRLEVVAPDIRSDEDITEDVRALLEGQEGLAQQAIVVEVRAGRVTLSGSVHDPSERRLAEDLALNAPGARKIVNQLVVAPAALGEAATVGRELEHVLANTAGLAGCGIRIALSGDVAVLSGTAQSRLQVEHAVKIVRGVWAGELRNEVRLSD